jgi:hypothetical protein
LKATGKAMAKVISPTLVTKHSSGVCGTSKMMLLWKKRATALCPRCLLEVEDATHVWQCQDPRALNVWTQAIANLETWMQKQRTEPGIIRVICQALGLQSGSTEEIQVGTFTLFRRWFRNRMRSDGNPFWKAGPCRLE